MTCSIARKRILYIYQFTFNKIKNINFLTACMANNFINNLTMHQTITSFGTNLTNSFTSQSPKNRLRFNQRVSFFDEKLTGTRTKDFYSSKEQLSDYILSKQESANFIDYQEFQDLAKGEVAVSVLSHYNNQFKSTGWDESLDEFNSRIEQLVEAVRRRFPFVKILRKVSSVSTQDRVLQIQLCSNYDERRCLVLYQETLFPHEVKPRSLVDAVTLFVHKFNLVVTADCEQKDQVPVGCDHNHANKLLEGLRVTVRQKEDSNQMLSPTKQIVIKSSFCNMSASRASNSKADIFKTNENINLEKQVRVYFSPAKTQNWMTVTTQGDLVHKNYKSSGKKQQQETRLPVKLFSQTALTNYFEQVTFQDLVQQIKHYEIEITGEKIKPSKTLINVDELLLTKDEQLMVSIRVERADVARCLLKVTKDNIAIRDAVVKVSTSASEGYELVQDYDSVTECFYFFGQVGTMYYLELQKMDCFAQKRTLHMLGDCILDIELVGCVQTQLRFRAYNVTDNTSLEGVMLDIHQPEDQDKEIIRGHSDDKGTFSCPGLMFKQIHLKAKRKGFLSISYDYDVRANSTGTVLSIPMLPDYYSLINQYHVIVYVPQKNEIQMDFQLRCPDQTTLDERNKAHKHYKAKLEVLNLRKQAKLYNFQVHVQCLDPFMKNNLYSFLVCNIKNQRVPLCRSPQSPRPPAKTVNEMFLTTRLSQQNTVVHQSPKRADVVAQKINNFCAEDSVRVFVTFGHEVINTFMIQTNVLSVNEKCFGMIDLDKRRFTYCDDEIVLGDCQKSIRTLKLKQQQAPQDNLGQILSLITNQKLKLR